MFTLTQAILKHAEVDLTHAEGSWEWLTSHNYITQRTEVSFEEAVEDCQAKWSTAIILRSDAIFVSFGGHDYRLTDVIASAIRNGLDSGKSIRKATGRNCVPVVYAIH